MKLNCFEQNEESFLFLLYQHQKNENKNRTRVFDTDKQEFLTQINTVNIVYLQLMQDSITAK